MPSSSYRRDRGSPWPMVVAMIVASAGVHLVLWPVGDEVLSMTWTAPPLPAAGGLMEVSLIGPEDEPMLGPPEPEPPQIPGELVQPDRVIDERPPDEASRVSEFDSRVDKETRAPLRKSAREYTNETVGEEAGKAASAAPQSPSQDEVPPSALPLGRLDPATSDDQGHRSDRGDLALDMRGKQTNEAGGTAPPPRPGLRGNAEAMRKTFGGSGSHDGLDDVEEGSESLLNTERFRFASFFNRMRNGIAQYWDPNDVMHRVDPDGRVYGRTTRKTLLHIRLTPSGAIQKIDVVKGCGVRELDREAIDSVQQAAPFVNPPPQMVDEKTGFIEIDFMFVLEEGRMTIHRYLR